MTIHDGGPAFPQVPWANVCDEADFVTGMSLRMYLAGEALKHPATHIFRGEPIDYVAIRAFEIADAMLRYERNSGVKAKP